MIFKRFLASMLLSLAVVATFAQQEYYVSVDGVKGGAQLKTALYNLIKDHERISYGSGSDATWGAFYTTDAAVENGQRRVLDMYSNEKRYFTSKGSAVSGMNIEHSVAKSWWGGAKNDAYCDLHHLNPSDQTANGRKGNYPLGELTSVSWNNGVAFVGKANIDGESINAYEPCDEYKGDFARVFMYMFTCYQNLTWRYTWMNYENSTYPTLKPWAVELLLKWHKQDPVSEKEVNRNNAVYAVQGNRNPYVDYPQLADYVWGDSVNYVFNLNGDVEDGAGGSAGGEGEGSDGSSDAAGEWRVCFEENFNGTEMVFTTYETVGDYPWELSGDYNCALASSYVDGENYDAESWLLSPSVDLTNDIQASISFKYVVRYCEPGKVAEHHQLLICNDFDGDVENSVWEPIDFDVAENSVNWDLTQVTDIAIPQKYLGERNVTIAFRYVGTETKAGTFEVDDVVVRAMANGGNEGNNGEDGEDGDGSGNEGNNGEDGDGSGNDGNNGNFTGGAFTLVTNAEQLTAGDSIVIAYGNFVMGQQKNNYRAKTSTDAMISGNEITYMPSDAQKVLLEEGTVEGSFALNVGNGYLAATSSSSNSVATVETVDENASWVITIDDDALAVVKAQGNKTRNTLQYNTSSPRFSCYIGTQKSVKIYAKSPVTTSIVEIPVSEDVNVYTINGVMLRSSVQPQNATNGLPRGIYIVGDKKIFVK